MQIVLYIVYAILMIYTIIKIVLDTRSTPKTLAYLLLIIVLPFLGIILYYAIGINYRHHRSISKGIKSDSEVDLQFQKLVENKTESLIHSQQVEITHFEPLVHFLKGIGNEHLSLNDFHILINGEAKFPEVLKSLKKATHFIHMEYYDWENDIRGNQIKEVLLQKAKEGIAIKVLYDDYASRKIKKNIIKELEQGGILICPKIKIKFKEFANRINHRDHRKIIIVDGIEGFVGGINISDRYDNSIDTGLYWRDTHVKFTGPLVLALERHFLVSWNSSSPLQFDFSNAVFPKTEIENHKGIRALGQLVVGGPIYPNSNIMLSYMKIFTLAKEKIYITNPYFIPSESILNALCQAALSGVDVRLMVPEKSDSAIVGAASKFYFDELLAAGVRIFLYKKGFIHAKTIVADSQLSIIGTANMDIRSFDLNFEIMSVIYSHEMGQQLEQIYTTDLNECREIILDEWNKKGIFNTLAYAIARLISSFL